MKREDVLRLAHKIGDIACGNEGVVDHAHDVSACETCGRIADLIIDFVTPDPDPIAASDDGAARPSNDLLDECIPRVLELLRNAGITEPDELKHTLEEHARAFVNAYAPTPEDLRATTSMADDESCHSRRHRELREQEPK